MGECIAAGKVIVTGRQLYKNGNFIPFKLEIGDNCCSDHALGKARDMLRLFQLDGNRRAEKWGYDEDTFSMVIDDVIDQEV